MSVKACFSEVFRSATKNLHSICAYIPKCILIGGKYIVWADKSQVSISCLGSICIMGYVLQVISHLSFRSATLFLTLRLGVSAIVHSICIKICKFAFESENIGYIYRRKYLKSFLTTNSTPNFSRPMQYGPVSAYRCWG